MYSKNLFNIVQFRFDRTADITSRVKMSQEMAKAINDGLFNYEDELWDPSDDEAWVSWDSLLFWLCPLLSPSHVLTVCVSPD